MPATRFFRFAVIIHVSGKHIVRLNLRCAVGTLYIQIQHGHGGRVRGAELRYVGRKPFADNDDFQLNAVPEIMISPRAAVRA